MAGTQRHNADAFQVIEIESNLVDAKKPECVILTAVATCNYDEESIFAIKLALEEAMTNAVRHGNRGDEHKHIVVRYSVNPQRVIICVRDEGLGFRPDEIPDPTSPERISLPSGRGIMLMRAYMDEVEYSCDGREVRMVKINPRGAGRSGPPDTTPCSG